MSSDDIVVKKSNKQKIFKEEVKKRDVGDLLRRNVLVKKLDVGTSTIDTGLNFYYKLGILEKKYTDGAAVYKKVREL